MRIDPPNSSHLVNASNDNPPAMSQILNELNSNIPQPDEPMDFYSQTLLGVKNFMPYLSTNTQDAFSKLQTDFQAYQQNPTAAGYTTLQQDNFKLAQTLPNLDNQDLIAGTDALIQQMKSTVQGQGYQALIPLCDLLCEIQNSGSLPVAFNSLWSSYQNSLTTYSTYQNSKYEGILLDSLDQLHLALES